MVLDRRNKVLRWALPIGCALLLAPVMVLAQEAAPVVAAAAAAAPAEPPPPTIADAMTKIADAGVVANTIWTLIAGMLVFFMNLGFCTLEAGLCRRKNAVNVLAKNFIVFGVSSIAFWVAGFGMMFGKSSGGFVGTTGMMPTLLPGTADLFPGLAWSNVAESVKFFFQLVFAGTAATIVSGAVAERIKFGLFILFSFLLVAFVYPVTGHWIWGGGWLSTLSRGAFHDFAGSTVVHSVGAYAALAGVIVLGPRIGKYNADGSVNPMPGHSMGLAAIGTFVLWLGWFGFNPGSTMTANLQTGHIAVTTNTAAAFGSITATITAWLVLGKPDFSMILNGCLCGLVAVTAPCAVITVGAAAVIGAMAGVLAVFGVIFWDKLRLDDPVGALTVHLIGGTFGTICVGLFASGDVIKAYAMDAACKPGLFYGGGATQLVTQFIGIGAVAGTSFVFSLICWLILKAVFGIRVTAQEEIEGLDIGEHGMEAYPGFAKEEVGLVPSGSVSAMAPKGSLAHA